MAVPDRDPARPDLAAPIPPPLPLPFFRFVRAAVDDGIAAFPEAAYGQTIYEIK
jgi:hypothetical protein